MMPLTHWRSECRRISRWSVATPPSPLCCSSCSGTSEERLLCCGNQDARRNIHIPNKIVPKIPPKIQTLPKLIQNSLWSNQTQKSQNPLKEDPSNQVEDPSHPHLSYSPSVWSCPRGRWRGRAAGPGRRRWRGLTWWWWPPWCRAPGRSRAATVQPSTWSQYYMWVWSHHVSCKSPISPRFSCVFFLFSKTFPMNGNFSFLTHNLVLTSDCTWQDIFSSASNIFWWSWNIFALHLVSMRVDRLGSGVQQQKLSISCQCPLTEVQLLTNVINVTTNYLNISKLSTLCTALLFQTRPHTTQ